MTHINLHGQERRNENFEIIHFFLKQVRKGRNEISIFKITYAVCQIIDRVTGIGRADVIDIYRKMDRFLEKKQML